MTTLNKEEIQNGIKVAMKSGDKLRLSTLRLLLSAIKYAEIEKGEDLAEDDYLKIVSREIKKRREAIPLYKQGKRLELAEKEEKEAEILSAFLPEQLSGAEVDVLVKDAITESGATGAAEMGKVMSLLMPKVKGRADGKELSQKVRDQLEKGTE